MTEKISKKQLRANQKNAKKGGVKTAEGKAVSRYNALKHGLLSKQVLLPEEDENELVELGKRIRSELKPKNEIENILVDRIVANTWRLRRALKVEVEMIKWNADSTLGPTKDLGNVFGYDFINHDSFGKFQRYETSIERSIYKALHELQRIRSAESGEKPLAPIAVDVSHDD